MMTSSPIRILWNLNINRPRVYQSDISNFILIKHKRTEIQSREVNRIMKKTWVLRHYDLDLWPKVINFNRARTSVISNHLAKTASKSEHRSAGILFTRKLDTQTDRQTDTHTQTNCSENITPPRFRGGVINQSINLKILNRLSKKEKKIRLSRLDKDSSSKFNNSG